MAMSQDELRKEAIYEMCEKAAGSLAYNIFAHIQEKDSEEVAKLRGEIDTLNNLVLRQQREINRLCGTPCAGKVGAA